METTSDQSNSSSPSSSSPSSKYKGVRKRKWGKWVSEIRLPNSRERIWLGSYDTEEKAARAFDAALFCLRGSHAQFNFPDSPPEIVNGRTLTPPEIQEAAAKFANEKEKAPQARRNDQSNQVGDNNDSGETIDWSFLEALDGSGNEGGCGSEFGIYPDELLYDDDGPGSGQIGGGDDDGDDDGFPHEVLLWNFDNH